MPYVDYKTPIESKINWVQGISFVIQALTLALNHEWVVANPRATLIIGMVINALTAILRTFFPTASTTWAIKAAALLALTLALSVSPAHAAEPKQTFITKAQYEANVLPWGVGTNFVKDQEDRFWIIHKHMPPMQARVDGTPIFPLDEQMWNGVMLEHAKKKAKPVAPPAKPVKPTIKLGGDWADGFDGLISVIEQAKEAAANGDPSLLDDVRANLIANRAALKVGAKQEAAFGPDFAQWFKAMPLPRIIANPFRALFSR